MFSKICHFRGKIEFIFGENHNFNALYLLFKNEITAGRLNCCGMEDRTIVAHGCWKTKMIICGMEGENVVDNDRLTSTAPIKGIKVCILIYIVSEM